MDLAQYIRDIPDWPKPGVLFKDITTLLKEPEAFREAVDRLAEPFMDKDIDLVVSVEARGFIFGGALAYKLGAGFVPARKPGKLPAETIREEYALEYGTDALEIHKDAIKPGQKVLLFDDVLATGGTLSAAARLIERLGGEVVGVSLLIDLTFLKGREKLKKYPIYSLIEY
ncbi:MAG: adenine phosphoribosyltransferase [Chloroflexi bacterium]|nr:MAG: adenine phosphoribosyltransferase [Chloroflexota bacterium]HDN80361.1 adenine phosphoribosyltransferase [Chloroflexota bacterium]